MICCPRCGNTRFDEIDCGPDSYEDDIFYISYRCTECGLWLDGWSNEWYADIEDWKDTENAKPWRKQE